jgi:hypothetical protein
VLSSRSFSGRVLIFGGIVVAGLLALQLLLERRGLSGGGPDAGTLAPYHGEWLGPWHPVLAAAASAEAPGDIIAIASSARDVVLLSQHNWWVVRDGRSAGPFGATEPGAPGWISRAVSVAVRDDSVYILDGGTGRLVVSGIDGGGAHAFRIARGIELELYDWVVVDSRHRPIISRLMYGSRGALTGNWQALRLLDTIARDTLYDALRDSASSSPLAIPLLATMESSRTVLLESETYALTQFADVGQASVRTRRADPPRWRFPDSVRAKYQSLSTRLSPEQRARWTLPDYFPAVRRMAGLSGDRLAVLVPTASDSAYVEVIDLNGTPLGRLLDRPTPDPLFLTQDHLYRIIESSDSTIVTGARILGP